MTRRGHRVRGFALVVGAVLVLAGCGDSGGETPTKGTTTGSAASTTNVPATTPDAAAWDPCGLPDSAITATGLDPASKKADIAGVKWDGWKVCTWRATAPERWYELTIYAGAKTLQDFRNRPDFTEFEPLTVGSHSALMFRSVSDKKRRDCDVAVEVGRNVVWFGVLTRAEIGQRGDPCAEARRHAEDLTQYLPGS